MSNVADYAEERAARSGGVLDVDPDVALIASDEMAAALAAAPDIEPEQPAASVVGPLQAQWWRFRDGFAEAMGGGLYTVEQLEEDIARGEAYFWPGKAAALVGKVVGYPSGERVMQVLWATGDLDEVLALLPGVEATGRLLGCGQMLVEGRKAWERVLKAHGYDFWSVTVGKVL